MPEPLDNESGEHFPLLHEGTLPVVHMGETLYVRRKAYRLGLLIVHQGEVFHLQGTGQIAFQYQPKIFAEYVKRIPPALIVGCHIATKVKDIADYYAEDPHFQVAASPISTPGNAKDWETILGPELAAMRPNWNTEEAMFNNGLHIKYFGWKKKSHGAYSPKHYAVDPYLFAHQLPETFRRFSLVQMIEWSTDLLEWLDEHDLIPGPAYHKIAAQLMREFFNEGPSTSLNENLRDSLPGNHYRYFANPKVCYSKVYEVDQSNAHHFSATAIQFPLKHSLQTFAHADFPADHVLWRPANASKWEKVMRMHGLFLLKVHGGTRYSRFRHFNIPPADAGTQSDHLMYAFSNEIPYLQECGLQIRYIVAAFVSEEVDIQPNIYGKWALGEVHEASPMRKAWLKPLLLSTWGMLGARPFSPITVQLHGAGESKRFHVGRERYMQLNYNQSSIGFTRYTNIIHRGMVEAETRLRTLKMARSLAERGMKVLAIYADGVYVKDTVAGQLPLIPGHWKVKEITNAYFPRSGQVICDQYEKVPGMIGRIRKTYVSHIRRQELSV